MTKNFPNLVEEFSLQIQEAQEIPDRIQLKKTIPIHVIFKLINTKDKD